ncbi:MAG TPA: hemerythrin domain-containing protein [Acidimicrobiales bacterium]|nr:hemerythrin domain-containing protein [Acidimicrobiales bacterium]
MADAVSMLEQDHRKVEQLFEQYEQTGDPTIVQQICTELKVHTTIEEEVVYPVVARDVSEGKELDKEARKEHQEVEDAIKQIESLGYDAAEVDELMQTIMEGVTHHVEEEESQMFPKLREELGGDRLTELGEKLAQAKQQAMRTAGAGSVVEGDMTEMTKDQLYEQAKQAGIEGRSDMTKDELIEALDKQ